MARRKNTRPTFIYWLADTRTGVPFYCGKTVLPLHQRLACHRYEAAHGTRRVHQKVRECGEHIRIDHVEIVAVGDDWSAREKFWIRILRGINSDCCNAADGGAGAPGWIPTAEQRAKIVATWKGRKHSPETRAKISAFLTGRKRSPESVAKSAAGVRGKKHSAESIANMRAAQRARPPRGPHTPEHCAKISAANKGKKRSEETLKRMREAECSTRFKPGQRPHNARKIPPCPVPLP